MYTLLNREQNGCGDYYFASCLIHYNGLIDYLTPRIMHCSTQCTEGSTFMKTIFSFYIFRQKISLGD